MRAIRQVMAAGAVALAVAAGLGWGQPKGASTGGSKDALTEKNWEDLHKVLLPQKGDYPWEQVTWYASVWHARKKAAAEDKPILIWVTGGAGFNDPLGNC